MSAPASTRRDATSPSVATLGVRVLDVTRRFWRMIIVIVVAGTGLGAVQVARATPVYAAHVAFLVTTRNGPIDQTGSSLANDRARIYAGLAGLDGLARRVRSSGHLPGSVHAIAETMSGRADPDSAIITLTVQTTSVARALAIATATATAFPGYVASLDTPGARTPTIALTETSFPAVDATPVTPHKTRGILLGVLGGLIVAALVAALRTLLDQSVRTGSELSTVLGAPLLGEIPFDPSLVAGGLTRAAGPTLEAFRTLRTNMGFVGVTGEATVVVVSAAHGHAGTSTVVAGLAAAAVDDGQRVVVVDAHQLRPDAGAASSGGASTDDPRTSPIGLIDVLYGRVSLSAALRTAASGVETLAVGRGLRHAFSDRVATAALPQVLVELRERFELVLLDSPPVGGNTDTTALALAGADGVVLVARHGRTRVRALRNSRHALEIPRIPILGTVLVSLPHSQLPRATETAWSRLGESNPGQPHYE